MIRTRCCGFSSLSAWAVLLGRAHHELAGRDELHLYLPDDLCGVIGRCFTRKRREERKLSRPSTMTTHCHLTGTSHCLLISLSSLSSQLRIRLSDRSIQKASKTVVHPANRCTTDPSGDSEYSKQPINKQQRPNAATSSPMRTTSDALRTKKMRVTANPTPPPLRKADTLARSTLNCPHFVLAGELYHVLVPPVKSLQGASCGCPPRPQTCKKTVGLALER